MSNPRKDSWQDVQLFVGLNLVLLLAGGLIKVSQITVQGLSHSISGLCHYMLSDLIELSIDLSDLFTALKLTLVTGCGGGCTGWGAGRQRPPPLLDQYLRRERHMHLAPVPPILQPNPDLDVLLWSFSKGKC